MNDQPDAEVYAAGGVLIRRDRRGPEICLVHRPKYDDWSFPKGKLDAGESFVEAARREVEEETGYRVELGDHVGDIHYRDSRDRPKVARYWMMRPVDAGERFEPNEEIDDRRWFPVDEALEILSYGHDRALLASLPVGAP